MIRPLFIIGNKRSGTSLLVRLLNLHPQVFISHESDIVWILFQFHAGQIFRAHPADSEKGMRTTLASAEHLLQRNRSPWENYLAVQQHLMTQGNAWLPAMNKLDLRWIGDKKPFQHADPELLPFILEHFPDAHFLHIVRHPFAVTASSDRFNRTPNGDFWLGLSPEEKVGRWTFYEQQVLALGKKMGDRLHSLRYEDLCVEPQRELTATLKFLQLTPDPQQLAAAAQQTLPAANIHPAIRCSAETTQLARRYGYDLARPARWWRLLGEKIYSRTIKRKLR